MTTRSHHIDIDAGNQVAKVSFSERSKIQREMIEDHAYLTGMPIEDAAMHWVDSGYAQKFADHYIHQ
jgi:hypothetical protein